MKRKDVVGFIDKIRIAYPSKKYYENKEDLEKLIKMWLEMFGEYTEGFMQMVLNRAILKNDYPPTFSSIDKNIGELIDDYERRKRELRDSIKHWEDLIQYDKEEEKVKHQNWRKEAEEELKELEEFKVWDD